jgi:hypothetical protein
VPASVARDVWQRAAMKSKHPITIKFLIEKLRRHCTTFHRLEGLSKITDSADE